MPKIKFNYIKNELYAPTFANGALGGLTPKGELVINFYTEISSIPKSQTHEVEGNTIQPEIISEREPKEDATSLVNATRIISTGVILSATTATEIHAWLGTQLEILKKIEDGRSK